MIKRLLKLKYILLFFLLAQLVIMVVVTINEIHDRDYFLENKTKLAQSEYDTIYWKIQEQSAMIFQETINKKEIIDIFKDAYTADKKQQAIIREKLYQKLFPSYNRLKKLIHLKQLHFHLPNNHSFLRVHKPDKFGDDLTNVRDTVAYVNKYKKPIDGFEEGRIYNGFRFVYPLSDEKNNHLGSVEISFASSSFQNTLSNNTRVSQFIFSKKIIEKKVWHNEITLNYLPSKISPHFFIENNWDNNSQSTEIKKKIHKYLTPKITKVFEEKLISKKAYSISLETPEQTYILSFLPIKNPIKKNVAAYIIVIVESSYLQHLHFENKLLKLVSFALLITLFILIYRRHKHEDEYKQQLMLLTQQSKMAQMGSMLSNIAHQWKQPLARINSILIQIPLQLSLKKDEEIILTKHLDDIENLTQYMGNTIESFRHYFHPKKKKSYFYLKPVIEKALDILDVSNSAKDIDVSINISQDIRVYNYEDEIIQVIITLFVNAVEAFENQQIEKKFINITVEDKISKLNISITDNAGGIEDEIISQIFNPYFSTKDNSKNDGIGLYMAKTIVEYRMKGKLTYENDKTYSRFTISIEGLK